MFKRLFSFLVLPYWMIIEAVYFLRFGVMLSLFLAIVLSMVQFEYKLIFSILITVVLGGMVSIFGGSYYYSKTKNIFLESEMNMLEREIEVMPSAEFSGIPTTDADVQKAKDDSLVLSLIRAVSFLIGAIPIFSPYLFSIKRYSLIKIVILFSFVILLVVGIVEGKIRAELWVKNVLKEIGLGIVLVMSAYFWGSYLITLIK